MAKQQPAHKVQLGKIVAAIWANETDKKEVWFSVTVGRRFKSNGEWKDTASFGRDDLPVAAKAMDMAYAWIWEQQPAPKTANA